MLSRWRDEFNAGRRAVRAASGIAEPSRTRGIEPQSGRGNGGEGPPSPPPDAGQEESLHTLLGEVRQIAELSLARTAELETELTATHWHADRVADVLQLAGVRPMLLKVFHPDAHAGIDEDQRRALTEAISKINAAYDLIDRAKDKKP